MFKLRLLLNDIPVFHENLFNHHHHNYNKILKSDWLSTPLISALIGQYASCLSNWTVRATTRALTWLFFTAGKKKGLGISCVLIYIKSLIYHKFSSVKLWLTGNKTLCRPVRSVIVLVIKQIRLPILLITRMITDRIGLPSVLLPLLILLSSSIIGLFA